MSQLYDLLLEIRDQYSEILMKKWVEVFNGIFDMDNYTPITVTTREEYDAIIAIYPFMDSQLEKVNISVTLDFIQLMRFSCNSCRLLSPRTCHSHNLCLMSTAKSRNTSTLASSFLRIYISGLPISSHLSSSYLVVISLESYFAFGSLTEQEEMVWKGAKKIMHTALRDVIMQNISNSRNTCAQVSK